VNDMMFVRVAERVAHGCQQLKRRGGSHAAGIGSSKDPLQRSTRQVLHRHEYGPAVPVAVDDAYDVRMGEALKLMGLALQGDDGSEVFVERLGQHLDRDMRIARARFGPTQVDGLEDPAHAAFADQRNETEPALQDIADADSRRPLPGRLAATAGDDGRILRPLRDLLRNRFVPVVGQGLRRLVISQGFQQSRGRRSFDHQLPLDLRGQVVVTEMTRLEGP